MRVLIITHPRSGGYSLTIWLSKELGCKYYHEPFNVESEIDIDLNVFTDKNCVVKIFPIQLKKFDIDIKNFMNTFDKIIIHKRENEIDVAISLAWTILHNKQPEEWHQTYEVKDDWIYENRELIDSQMNRVKYFDREIDELKIDDHLKTTYNSIFENKTDVYRILDFLNYKNQPRWLDYLDNSRKLKNGTIGMNNIKIKKEII